MKFDLFCTKPVIENGNITKILTGKLFYDNMTSELFDPNGEKYIFETKKHLRNDFFAVSEHTPGIKSNNIRVLKIQLGLACNYSCEYCSQRFVPNSPETNKNHAEKFMNSLDKWLFSVPERIEFWGGEPFVYWKTLKPLAEELRKKFPKASFLIITNGSLLNDEIIEWIDRLDINIGISHDGPGQHVRGPDPFDDPLKKEMIVKLFQKRPKKVSFNSMIHRENVSRIAIQEFLTEQFPHIDFAIGEGGFIDTYDEGGKSMSLLEEDEHYAFRVNTLKEIRSGKINLFIILQNRINEWQRSIVYERAASALGQKCGMDKSDTIAVDLRGNVITCQNVSAVSTAPNGRPHLIGHVSNMEKVALRTATHWKFREECLNCPVLQVCKGSCMFLQDDLFKKSCDNAYSDHVPFFATALELMTGWFLYRIEAHGYNLPEERMDVWGEEFKRRKVNVNTQN